MRINKYIASCGICSRREADRLIEQGRVLVNGSLPAPGCDVSDGDEVTLDGKPVSPIERKVVLAYNKPVGVTCSERDDHAGRLVVNEIDYPVRVTYAGRLDRDSEGLLLLSNDGDFINNLMKGSNAHEREYLVETDIRITDDFIDKIQGGVYLRELDVTTRPCRAYICDRNWDDDRIENSQDNVIESTGHKQLSDVKSFGIVLTQGLNRQIRRMCEALGARVLRLRRIRIENITLGDLGEGQYRELGEDELAELRKRGIPVQENNNTGTGKQ